MTTAQLALALRKDHAESRSWQKTAERFGIPNKGIAYRIALKGYDPADKKLREALGLGPRPCPSCKRKQYRRRPYWEKPISKRTAAELRWSLEHRELLNG